MNLLIEWNNLVLDAIRALGKLPVESRERNRGGPPQIARSLAVMSHGIIFPQGATHYSKHGLSLKASYPPMATRQSVHETASRSTDNPEITE